MKTITLHQSTCCHYLFSAWYRNEWLGDVFRSEMDDMLRRWGATHYIIDNAFTGRKKYKVKECE